jgi:UDP-N-acetyl-2-amino-2-deoxyglucuronate dehydrogenase
LGWLKTEAKSQAQKVVGEMAIVRLGVIGCGVIGRQHLKVAQKCSSLQVVAVADLREEVARETAKEFGIPRAYGSAEALLEDAEVEAVVLAFPTAGRAQVALQAFARGKHVLMEKPVAMNADEVRQMIAAKGNLVAGCCSSRHRFLPSAQVIKEALESGLLGDLRLIRIRAIRPAEGPPETPPPAWRLRRDLNGGGILMNWGCYDLDYLQGLLDWQWRPTWVLAQMWTVPSPFLPHVAPGSDAETHVVALLRDGNGLTVAYERGEYMPTASDDVWEIIGERGSLRFKMVPDRGKVVVFYEATTEQGVTPKVLWQGDESWEIAHAGPLTDFAAAILEQRPPKTSLEQALIVQQITDAIYASAMAGKPMALDWEG